MSGPKANLLFGPLFIWDQQAEHKGIQDDMSAKSQVITQSPTREDWCRLAAYIDGEGCIDINIRKPRKPGWSPKHNLQLRITNTDPRLAQWLVKTFGGSYCASESSCRKLGARHVLFQWDAASGRAEWILRSCIDLFIIKRHQAEIALAFRETFVHCAGREGTSDAVTEHRHKLREQLRDSRNAFATAIQ